MDEMAVEVVAEIDGSSISEREMNERRFRRAWGLFSDISAASAKQDELLASYKVASYTRPQLCLPAPEEIPHRARGILTAILVTLFVTIPLFVMLGVPAVEDWVSQNTKAEYQRQISMLAPQLSEILGVDVDVDAFESMDRYEQDMLFNGLSEEQLAALQSLYEQHEASFSKLTDSSSSMTPFVIVFVVMALVSLVGTYAGISITASVANRRRRDEVESQNRQIEANNKMVERKNEQALRDAERHNAEVTESIADVSSQLEDLREIFESEVKPWYPPDYVSVGAAAELTKIFMNHKADTLKEAIVLYDTQVYRADSLDLQRQANDKLDLANALSESHLACVEKANRLAEENNELSRKNLIANTATAIASGVTAGYAKQTAVNSATAAANSSISSSLLGSLHRKIVGS